MFVLSSLEASKSNPQIIKEPFVIDNQKSPFIIEGKLAEPLKVVVYMKRLPPPYDAAVDHFLL